MIAPSHRAAHADLVDAIAAVADITAAVARDGAANDGLAAHLERSLYAFYCRDGATPYARRRDACDPTLVDALSAANCGRGTRDPGWRLLRTSRDGRHVVEKYGVALWARSDQLAPGPDGHVALTTGKELRALVPGFYMALGDAADPSGEGLPSLVRYYWNLAAAADAVRLVELLTAALNRSGLAFRLKVPNHPDGYGRADAAVLYLPRDLEPAARGVLGDVYAAVGGQLGADVPRFALALRPGLAVAEDPQTGESFGQHRCRAIADGLLAAARAGDTAVAAQLRSIEVAFERAGIDPLRPYRAKGSTCTYAL